MVKSTHVKGLGDSGFKPVSAPPAMSLAAASGGRGGSPDGAPSPRVKSARRRNQLPLKGYLERVGEHRIRVASPNAASPGIDEPVDDVADLVGIVATLARGDDQLDDGDLEIAGGVQKLASLQLQIAVGAGRFGRGIHERRECR